MAKTEIKQLDSRGEIYATVDERGAIIGTGTRDVCNFLMMLANQEFKTQTRIKPPTGENLGANVRSAIKI